MAIILLVLSLQFPSFHALSFNFSNFSNTQNLNISGDAFLSLTRNRLLDASSSGGRALYSQKLQLWDGARGQVSDFVTHFSFNISMLRPPDRGDGMAFFLAPNTSNDVPENSLGGCLGLITECEGRNATMVAIEFDTWKNVYDTDDNHVGINVNSIRSVTTLTWPSSIRNGSKANSWISYDSERKNLSLFLTYDDNPVFRGQSSLSYEIDLTKVLPEWVTVGLSSATGDKTEVHYILSWQFNSTTRSIRPKGGGLNVALVLGCAVGGILILGAGFMAIFRRSRRPSTLEEDDSMDQEFEQGMGPRITSL